MVVLILQYASVDWHTYKSNSFKIDEPASVEAEIIVWPHHVSFDTDYCEPSCQQLTEWFISFLFCLVFYFRELMHIIGLKGILQADVASAANP